MKQTPEDTDLEYIPLFDPEKPTSRQIFVSKEYRPDLDAYPLPDYVASAVYAEIDVELSNYRLNAIKSGFNAGTILNFSNGRPTEEDGIRRAMLIAQDVQAVLPEAVVENKDGELLLQYTEIIPLLVAAIKEQSALITQLTARITALESA